LLSSAAHSQNVKVINVFHGGSFGVQVKPNFFEGEGLLCDVLVTYGTANSKWIVDNAGTGGKYLPPEIINGSYDWAKILYRNSPIRLPQTTDKLMYVPTTLRGADARYGPYEDWADEHYFEWWKILRILFGAKLVVKLHPKSRDNRRFPAPVLKANFELVIDSADTFIFDYVSTAFTLAAATTKPIIFIDFGLQNYDAVALEAIKGRTIYFDLRQGIPPDFATICDMARGQNFDYNYTKSYSGVLLPQTTEEALMNYVATAKA
jgi:hypothetical protein